MKRVARAILVCGVVMMVASAAAFAEEEEEDNNWLPGSLAGNVAYYTDYSFRGISQTQRDMAFQGGLDWTHDTGIHVGLWTSSIKFRGDKSYIEQDFYGGYAGAIGDFSYDILGVYYFYPMGANLDYIEAILNTAYDFKVAKVSMQFLGSPDYFGTFGIGTYLKGGVNVPIPLDLKYVDFSFDTTVGWTTAEHPAAGYGFDPKNEDYVDWSVALMAALPFNMSLDFRYVGTDVSKSNMGGTLDAGDRFVFGAKYSF